MLCQVVTPGIDASAYSIEGGYVSIPDVPGFGLVLDEAIFKAAVEAETGRSYGKLRCAQQRSGT